MKKESDVWFIIACLIILIGFLLVIFYNQWGFRKASKCEEAQKYIAECYKKEGDFEKVIDECNQILAIYEVSAFPSKGMKVQPLQDRDMITPEVIKMFKDLEKTKRQLRKKKEQWERREKRDEKI